MSEEHPETITFTPIGVMRSSHHEPRDTPIQPVFAPDCEGCIEVDPRYEEGLRDIEGFSHLIVLYHLHRAGAPQMTVRPFLEDREHGVFATRHPARPNAIGLSIVELVRREGATLHLRGVDILDGTPVLDIKPYVSRFDRPESVRDGWAGQVAESDAEKRGRRGYKERA